MISGEVEVGEIQKEIEAIEKTRGVHNLRIWKAEAGRLWIYEHSWLHKELRQAWATKFYLKMP